MPNKVFEYCQSILLVASLLLPAQAFVAPVNEAVIGVRGVRPYLRSVASDGDSEVTSGGLSAPSACPFSMKYPRFRIPVSSAKDKSDLSRGGLFSGIKITLDRANLQKKYAQDLASNNFYWADPEDLDTQSDSDRIVKGKYGVFSSAFVWRKAADLLTSTEQDPKRIVIALPNYSIAGLQQLADIMNWLNEQEGTPFSESTFKIQAVIDDEAPVPTIILSREGLVRENLIARQYAHLSFEDVQAAMKSWVRRILVDLKVCPFTKSDTKSGQGLGDLGIPVGSIAYHHSQSNLNEIPLLMADTWEAIFDMIKAGPSGKKGVSSILLSAPEFDDNFSLWAGPVFAMLEQNVSAASAEPLIGVVCFHPKYKTPDGKSWPGFGHMHSVPRLRKWLDDCNAELSGQITTEDIAGGGAYQRRTPFATINVLRAEQLEAGEGRRETPVLYSTNIRRLYEVGFDKLEKELQRDKTHNA